jgi:tyrosine phenol-lyase
MKIQQQIHEPHKIKTVRLLPFPTLDERKKNLAEARFNVFNLLPSQVTFDMCSNAMNAVSQEQLSAQFLGDEAYAGARNFENLAQSVAAVFGHSYVCPVHNVLGSIKLILATMTTPGSIVPTNHLTWVDILTAGGLEARDVRFHEARVFTGDVDIVLLEEILGKGGVSIVDLQAFADGQHPFSLANLRTVRDMTRRHGVRLICNGSRVIENAWYIQQNEPGWSSRSIAEIVMQIAKTCNLFQMDGAQDPKCNTGGVLSTDNPDDYEKLMNEVVVYEGLHTYGGMAGRTMEMLARGLVEMCDESEVHWVMQQTERFTERLRAGGVPMERGCDGAYIEMPSFLPHIEAHAQDAFSAALYQSSGVRALAHGRVDRDNTVPVQIPRLAMTNEQLDQVADAIIELFRQREKIQPMQVSASGEWRDQMEYHGVFADLEPYEFDTFPYEIHTFERIGALSQRDRVKAIRAAGYNTFLLRSADVGIDLLTDSGTSAMSTDQWAACEATRATTGNSEAYQKLVANLQEITGYEHIIPTHQGRAAEHILSSILIKPGQLVPGNMYFTTTKLHQELAGGVFADIIVDEAHDPQSEFPWKGNIDLAKLQALFDEHGAEGIAYVSFEHCVNMAGGQPASMDNMKDVYSWCQTNGIPLIFDATRCVENARMIQSRDPRYHDVKIRDILREMMLYGDGCTVSGKKDFLINIGGIQAFRDNADWASRARHLLRLYEGNITDGGLATADVAAMARGVEEMLNDRYIRSHVAQTRALGQMLIDGGVPIVRPPGGHAIFLDAKRFLPHIKQEECPAQTLTAEIYIETGVRTMERGIVSKGRDPKTGENYQPDLELVRLTIPRRVYTNDHMRGVAEGIIRLYQRRDEIRGLRFVYEPAQLRFFQARFEPIGNGGGELGIRN